MSNISVVTRRRKHRLERRHKHIKKVVLGTPERPRVVVFRSNLHIYAQLVDDMSRRTITGCSTLTPALKEKVATVKGKIGKAKLVGEQLAVLAKDRGITRICFDRNGCHYHGRVKALAEGIRSGGVEF